jgi:hypothetical protein
MGGTRKEKCLVAFSEKKNEREAAYLRRKAIPPNFPATFRREQSLPVRILSTRNQNSNRSVGGLGYSLALPWSSNPMTTRPPATIIGLRIRLGSFDINRIASFRVSGDSFLRCL